KIGGDLRLCFGLGNGDDQALCRRAIAMAVQSLLGVEARRRYAADFGDLETGLQRGAEMLRLASNQDVIGNAMLAEQGLGSGESTLDRRRQLRLQPGGVELAFAKLRRDG